MSAAARAAREDAARLRSDTETLRLAVRANLARSRRRLGEAQREADRAQARRAIPFASPWSGLHWVFEDESLERILQPLD